MVKIRELTNEELMFAESAWLLYNNREKILADPRMAYAPIDMQNALAYIDFGLYNRNATIGVYLDWWYTYERAKPTNEQGLPSLVVRFIGSPLSGQNKCQVVTTEGNVEEWWCPSFASLWEPFAWTCKTFMRNRPANLRPYTLEEVICMLKVG